MQGEAERKEESKSHMEEMTKVWSTATSGAWADALGNVEAAASQMITRANQRDFTYMADSADRLLKDHPLMKDTAQDRKREPLRDVGLHPIRRPRCCVALPLRQSWACLVGRGWRRVRCSGRGWRAADGMRVRRAAQHIRACRRLMARDGRTRHARPDDGGLAARVRRGARVARQPQRTRARRDVDGGVGGTVHGAARALRRLAGV
mmetsp:Transcript_8231/g.21837  ORF Transcript_8231/g.21837 Transcript_8231/m.21837 type:complete len:206 (+) Transcript_8231:1089-1706(+)